MDFNVNHQKLVRTDSEAIVAGAFNFYEATFTFTPEWTGLEKYVVFSRGNTIFQNSLSATLMPASAGLVLSAGDWNVSVHGDEMDGDTLVKRITTNVVKLTVLPSGGVDGDAFPAFGGDIGARILASEEDRNTAEEARAAAELLREEAETQREEDSAAAVSAANTAITNTLAAKTLCENATSAANTAAQSCNAATENIPTTVVELFSELGLVMEDGKLCVGVTRDE